jgi:hypothetical protein
MSIDDTWPEKYSDVIDSYVSWLPFKPVRSHSGHRRGYSGANIWSDIQFESYGPDHILKIKFESTDITAMLQYWSIARIGNAVPYTDDDELDETFEKICETYTDLTFDDKVLLRRIGRTNAGPSYRYKLKNCSTMVANLLNRTTRSRRVWPHLRRHIVWTPLRIKRFALAMGAERMTWGDFVNKEAGRNLSDEAKEMLLKVKKRQAGIGSTGAPDTFSGGKLLDEKNNMEQFVTVLL